jgi:hypothetical protein
MMTEEVKDERKIIVALEKEDFEIRWLVKPGYVSQEQSLKKETQLCYTTHPFRSKRIRKRKSEQTS